MDVRNHRTVNRTVAVVVEELGELLREVIVVLVNDGLEKGRGVAVEDAIPAAMRTGPLLRAKKIRKLVKMGK